MAAIVAWRLHKQIFSFDKTLEQVLIDQTDEELKVPIDALNNLPYYCAYIKVNTIEDYDGFFVYFETDTNIKQLELRFLILLNDGDVIPVVLELDEGYTIAECMQKTFIKDKYKNGILERRVVF